MTTHARKALVTALILALAALLAWFGRGPGDESAPNDDDSAASDDDDSGDDDDSSDDDDSGGGSSVE